MDNIVIIADDLTGAADTGVQFCPFYDDTVLVSYLQLSNTATLDPGSATALYTNSRALDMMSAHARLRFRRPGCRAGRNQFSCISIAVLIF